MTHEAPPANDTRPTKVLKTTEGTMPLNPVPNQVPPIEPITSVTAKDSVPPAPGATESSVNPGLVGADGGVTNGTGTTFDPLTTSAEPSCQTEYAPVPIVADQPKPAGDGPKPTADVSKPDAETPKKVSEGVESVGAESKPGLGEPCPVLDVKQPLPGDPNEALTGASVTVNGTKPAPVEEKIVTKEVISVVEEAKPATNKEKPDASVSKCPAEEVKKLDGEQVDSVCEQPPLSKDQPAGEGELAQIENETSKDKGSVNENAPSSSADAKPTSENPETVPEVEKVADSDGKGDIDPISKTSSDDLSEVTLSDYMKRSAPLTVVDPETLTDTSSTKLSPEKLELFHAAVRAREMVWILLAAGQGSRFVSDVPKVIHPLCGKPLAQHALDVAIQESIPMIVVVGHAREAVAKTLVVPDGAQVAYVCQEERMGTGHAVMVAAAALPDDYSGKLFLSYADNPGINHELVDRMERVFRVASSYNGDKPTGAVMLTGDRNHAGPNSSAYGRIVRDIGDPETRGIHVSAIVERKAIKLLREGEKNLNLGGKEWTPKELDRIHEFNSGIVLACAKPYLEALGNAKGNLTKKEPVAYEYYATDFVECLNKLGYYVDASMARQWETWRLEGSNTVEELAELGKKMEEAGKAGDSGNKDEEKTGEEQNVNGQVDPENKEKSVEEEKTKEKELNE